MQKDKKFSMHTTEEDWYKMANYPNLIHLQALTDKSKGVDLVCIEGAWYPARPLGYPSFFSRIKLAWLVFRGKADALIWPKQ